MSVEPKTESQWRSEGHTEEEIRAYSVIGLVLADPPADAVFLRSLADHRSSGLYSHERQRLHEIANKLERTGG